MKRRDRFILIAGWSVFALFMILGAWMIISFIDIISHNMETYKNFGMYRAWNFFTVMGGLIK